MNDSYQHSAQLVRAIIGDPFEWCEVPAGTFLYGDSDQRDNPRQILTLPTFAIAKYPITYTQFQTFIDAPDGFYHDDWWQGLAVEAKYREKPGDQEWKIANHPRERVSWYDTVGFCRWLSAKAGCEIRLPTEFEWEKAARGTDGRLYPWGNEFDKTRCNTSESELFQTTPVDQYPAGISPYGVMDMSGNVSEWCLNRYDEAQQDIPKRIFYVLRGGGWIYSPGDARAACRNCNFRDPRGIFGGFRICCPILPDSL